MVETSQQPYFLQSRHFGMIPGTEREEDLPDTSLSLFDLVEYSAPEMVQFLSSLDRVEVLQSGEKDWYAWRWRWGTEDRYIILDFTLFDGYSPIWGGSNLDIHCPFYAVVEFWVALRERFPASYLHDERDLVLYTVSSFINDFALPLLSERQKAADSESRRLVLAEIETLKDLYTKYTTDD
jgi:hypothetical protein